MWIFFLLLIWNVGAAACFLRMYGTSFVYQVQIVLFWETQAGVGAWTECPKETGRWLNRSCNVDEILGSIRGRKRAHFNFVCTYTGHIKYPKNDILVGPYWRRGIKTRLGQLLSLPSYRTPTIQFTVIPVLPLLVLFAASTQTTTKDDPTPLPNFQLCSGHWNNSLNPFHLHFRFSLKPPLSPFSL